MSDETAFIAALRTLAHHPAARNLRDDAAILPLGGKALVLTHDMMVEGVHFFPNSDPADIAWKLVATNMSDLAAKGAQPLGVLLGYILRDTDQDAAFADALGDALNFYDAPLLGGDTVSTAGIDAPRSFGLTAIGYVPDGEAPSRSGAQPGDMLGLCGAIGDAMLGYEALRDKRYADLVLVQSFLRPRALMKEGQQLAPLVNAMMDVSDGLLIDAYRLAEASGVTLHIDSNCVPQSPQAANFLKTLDAGDAVDKRTAMLRWGDDYALLFAAPKGVELPVSATVIGEVSSFGDAPLCLDGQMIADSTGLGFQHGSGAKHS